MVSVVAVRRVIVRRRSLVYVVFVFFGSVGRNVACVLSASVRGVVVLFMENAMLEQFRLACSFCYYREVCQHVNMPAWITCFTHQVDCAVYSQRGKCTCGYEKWRRNTRIFNRFKGMRITKRNRRILLKEEKEELKNMPDVKEYSKGKGDWISADDVEIGMQLDVLGAGEMITIEDKEYLALPIKLPNKDKEQLVRLGPRNVRRIIKSMMNTKTERWIGGKLEVIDIEDYGSMGKGIIFKGIPSNTQTSNVKPQQQLASEPKLSTTLKEEENEFSEDFKRWLSSLHLDYDKLSEEQRQALMVEYASK